MKTLNKTKDNMDLNTSTPEQDAIEQQKWRANGKNNGTDRSDDDPMTSSNPTSQGWPDYAIPISVYASNPDYMVAPVKTYTMEEIEEYERERANELQVR